MTKASIYKAALKYFFSGRPPGVSEPQPPDGVVTQHVGDGKTPRTKHDNMAESHVMVKGEPQDSDMAESSVPSPGTGTESEMQDRSTQVSSHRYISY